MMKVTQLKKWQRSFGIGLLELMLALSVIAIMLVVSVRYYSSANMQQEATSLVNGFSTIHSAVENYMADNPTAGVPTMPLLIQDGYLPNTFGTVTGNKAIVNNNPWGGTITVNGSNNMFTVVQTGIPGEVCNAAYGQLQSTLNTSLGETVVAKASSSTGGTTSGTSGGTGGTTTAKNGCGANTTITVTYAQ
ncbi:MAG: type II secretion system protein [Gammaproteobacteria bacterium]